MGIRQLMTRVTPATLEAQEERQVLWGECVD